MDGLDKTVRNSRRFCRDRPESVLDGLGKTVQKNYGRFCPKPSTICYIFLKKKNYLLFFYFVQWSLKLLRAFYRKIHRIINQKIYPQNNPKPFRPDLLPHCTTQQPQPRLNTPLSQINKKIYQPKTTQSRFRPDLSENPKSFVSSPS